MLIPAVLDTEQRKGTTVDNFEKDYKMVGQGVVAIMAVAVRVFLHYVQEMEPKMRNDFAVRSIRIAVTRQNELDKNGTQNDLDRLAFFLDSLKYAQDIFIVAYGIETRKGAEKSEGILATLEENIAVCDTGVEAVAELAARLPE